jgi:hypothetical protein
MKFKIQEFSNNNFEKIDIETVQTIWQELKHELIYAEKVCSYLGTFTSGLMATLQNKLSRSTEVQCILMRDSSVYRENLKGKKNYLFFFLLLSQIQCAEKWRIILSGS